MSDTKKARMQKVVLVTGGSGLVGKGVQMALEKPENKRKDEEWVSDFQIYFSAYIHNMINIEK